MDKAEQLTAAFEVSLPGLLGTEADSDFYWERFVTNGCPQVAVRDT